MLSVIMLSVVMLSVIMLSVIILSAAAPESNPEKGQSSFKRHELQKEAALDLQFCGRHRIVFLMLLKETSKYSFNGTSRFLNSHLV